MNKENRIFLKPGKNNKEDRLNFVKFWASYIKTVDDKEWSRQQNVLINSQFITLDKFYKELAETSEGREKIKKLRELKINK